MRIEITDQAEIDLRSIYEHIAYELQSPQNAAAQLSRLEGNINSLVRMPERYRKFEREPWSSRGWRIMAVDKYCVFYVPDHVNKTVYITRVLYGGRDIETVLSQQL